MKLSPLPDSELLFCCCLLSFAVSMAQLGMRERAKEAQCKRRERGKIERKDGVVECGWAGEQRGKRARGEKRGSGCSKGSAGLPLSNPARARQVLL